MATLKALLEYLGGSSDEAPRFAWRLHSPLWGIWWGLLLYLVIFFCGQSSKFIYIDF